MAHSRRIQPVADCIAYIESCGWQRVKTAGWRYFFRPQAPRSDGREGIFFTLTELRDAFNNGW